MREFLFWFYLVGLSFLIIVAIWVVYNIEKLKKEQTITLALIRVLSEGILINKELIEKKYEKNT